MRGSNISRAITKGSLTQEKTEYGNQRYVKHSRFKATRDYSDLGKRNSQPFDSNCLSLKISDEHILIKKYPDQEIIYSNPNRIDATKMAASNTLVDFDKISERVPITGK